jgi:glycosyltransferase involved in cell wall biosynthesis
MNDSLINFSSYLNGLGFGTSGLNLLTALENAGSMPAVFPLGSAEAELEHHKVALHAGLLRAKYFNYKAPSLRLAHQFQMEHHVGRGLKAGYSYFELDRLTPDEVHQINGLDVMFSPSEWAKGVMENSGVSIPIVVAPSSVDTVVFHPDVKAAKLPGVKPETTKFINVGKWSSLKSHDFILEAFNAAFRVNDDVLLIMVCHHPLRVHNFDGPKESEAWANMYNTSPLGLAGKIMTVPGRLPSQRDVASLVAASDCGFYPARGEGWNLGLAQTLSMGKDAICTNYAAHTEYAEKAGARLIHIDRLEPAFEHPFLPAGRGNWAHLGQSQQDQAVEHLRAIHKEKQAGGLKMNQRGSILFTHELTWNGCAGTILNTLGIS